MIVWFLVSLLMTAHGVPAADIPRPFATEAECNAAGFARGAEIAGDVNISHGVWTCYGIDFDTLDPAPLAPNAEPLQPKQEG